MLNSKGYLQGIRDYLFCGLPSLNWTATSPSTSQLMMVEAQYSTKWQTVDLWHDLFSYSHEFMLTIDFERNFPTFCTSSTSYTLRMTACIFGNGHHVPPDPSDLWKIWDANFFTFLDIQPSTNHLLTPNSWQWLFWLESGWSHKIQGFSYYGFPETNMSHVPSKGK